MVVLLVLMSATACGGGGGNGDAARTTTTIAARYQASASATADIAGPAFSGTLPLAQDPNNPSDVSPSESTIRVQLIDPASPPETRRTMSIGGAVRLGETVKTSGSRLTVSYIGDGVILTSTNGECSVTMETLDTTGATGRAECVDIDVGGTPLTIKAAFELKPLTATTTAPPATEPPASVP